MRILFVCSFGKDRSPTAAGMYHGLDGHEARSGGLHFRSTNPVTEKKLRWADVIVTFNQNHAQGLRDHWSEAIQGKRIECLNIENKYAMGAPALKQLIQSRMNQRFVGLPLAVTEGSLAHG